MGTTSQYVAMVTMCLLLGGVEAADPCRLNLSPCTCEIVEHTSSRKAIKVNCSHVDPELPSVPSTLPKRTAILDFSNNRLQPSALNSLCRYVNLDAVNLAGNHLTSIPANEFATCSIKTSINLSANTLDLVTQESLNGLENTNAIYGLESRRFEPDALSRLTSLEKLEILIHQVDIPDNLFANMKNLRELDMKCIESASMPTNLFEPLLSSLRNLKIEGASMRRIPPQLLHVLMNLESVELNLPNVNMLPTEFFQQDDLYFSLQKIRCLGITSLPKDTFNNLDTLRDLAIHGAEDLPSGLFTGLDSLESLDLSDSWVTRLPLDWFSDLTRLQSLSLRGVGLWSLEQDDLKALTSLVHIDVSHNEIRDIEDLFNGESSVSIQSIDLSHNDLQTFPSNLFAQRSSLRRLNLNDNRIRVIAEGALDNLYQLEELHLHNNKINRISPHMFLNNFRLGSLDLSSNVLHDLPPELFSQNNMLTDLNLADNRITDLLATIYFKMQSLQSLNVDYNSIPCNCDIGKLYDFLPVAEITGYCETDVDDIQFVEYLRSEANCSPFLEHVPNIVPKASDELSKEPAELGTPTIAATTPVVEPTSIVIPSSSKAVPVTEMSTIVETTQAVPVTEKSTEAETLRSSNPDKVSTSHIATTPSSSQTVDVNGEALVDVPSSGDTGSSVEGPTETKSTSSVLDDGSSVKGPTTAISVSSDNLLTASPNVPSKPSHLIGADDWSIWHMNKTEPEEGYSDDNSTSEDIDAGGISKKNQLADYIVKKQGAGNKEAGDHSDEYIEEGPTNDKGDGYQSVGTMYTSNDESPELDRDHIDVHDTPIDTKTIQIKGHHDTPAIVEDKENDNDNTTYIVLIIVGVFLVTVASVVTVGYFYVRRRSMYLVSRRPNFSRNAGPTSSTELTARELTEVPSIQVESIDEEGNVDVAQYFMSKK